MFTKLICVVSFVLHIVCFLCMLGDNGKEETVQDIVFLIYCIVSHYSQNIGGENKNNTNNITVKLDRVALLVAGSLARCNATSRENPPNPVTSL